MHPGLTALVVTQFGVVSRQQLLEFVSPKQLATMVRKNEIKQCHPKTYRFVVVQCSWEQRLIAATLSIASSVASHRSAARLWGLMDCDRIEVTTPRIGPLRRSDVLIHQSEQLDGHTTFVNGIPVTSVARTLVDLTSCTSLGDLARCLDKALHQKMVYLLEVRNCLDTMTTKGRSRITTLRHLIEERDDSDGRLESRFEQRVLRWMREAQLPEPVPQYWCTTTRRNYRMDLAYPELKIDIEIDGPHHLDPAVATNDRERDADTSARGWITLRCTLQTDRHRFIADLRSILERVNSAGPYGQQN